jgi:hypothetical protein
MAGWILVVAPAVFIGMFITFMSLITQLTLNNGAVGFGIAIITVKGQPTQASKFGRALEGAAKLVSYPLHASRYSTLFL